MPRDVLLVFNKYYDSDPTRGPAYAPRQFIRSLETSGLANVTVIFQDQHYFETGTTVDRRVLQQCERQRPDLIVIMFHCDSPYNPQMETIAALDRAGLPLVFLWPDLPHPKVHYMAEMVAPHASANVGFGPVDLPEQMPEKYLKLWCPMDPTICNDPGKERDIPVSFVGNMAGYPDRVECIQYVLQRGAPLTVSGGHQSYLSAESFHDLLQRSRMSVNFSRRSNGTAELKARVLEVMCCGAMLLESENDVTPQLFKPGVDFVPFSSPADLLEKIRYFLAHESERADIAAAGQRTVTQKYSNVVFWQTIFDRVDKVAADRRGPDGLYAELISSIQACHANPRDEMAVQRCRTAQLMLAKMWSEMSPDEQERAYRGPAGRAFRQAMSSGLKGGV